MKKQFFINNIKDSNYLIDGCICLLKVNPKPKNHVLYSLKYIQIVNCYMKSSFFVIFFIVLVGSFFPLVYGSAEIDKTAIVNSVIDAVTFETETQEFFKLADIEFTCTDIENSTGFITAKGLLASLVVGKTVYLDIDSQYITDVFGTGNRTVSVVYVDFNSTHLLNVNQILVEQRLVTIVDVENDFNPNDWTYFTAKENKVEKINFASDFPIWIIFPLSFFSILIIIIFKRKLTKKLKAT